MKVLPNNFVPPPPPDPKEVPRRRLTESPSSLGDWACFISLIPWGVLCFVAYAVYRDSIMPPQNWDSGRFDLGPGVAVFVGLVFASAIGVPIALLAVALACAGLRRNRNRNAGTAFTAPAKAAIWLNVAFIVVVASAWPIFFALAK